MIPTTPTRELTCREADGLRRNCSSPSDHPDLPPWMAEPWQSGEWVIGLDRSSALLIRGEWPYAPRYRHDEFPPDVLNVRARWLRDQPAPTFRATVDALLLWCEDVPDLESASMDERCGRLRGTLFDRRRFARLISWCAGDEEVVVHLDDDPLDLCVLDGDGWMAVIMPMCRTDDRRTVEQVPRFEGEMEVGEGEEEDIDRRSVNSQ